MAPLTEQAVWKHSNLIWNRMRSECNEDGIWEAGTITMLFKEYDILPHYAKVVKALKLMERIEILKRSSFRGTGKSEPTRIQLFFPNQPLSIQTWSEIHTQIYKPSGEKTKRLAEARLDDLVQTVSDLYGQVQHLENRITMMEAARSTEGMDGNV